MARAEVASVSDPRPGVASVRSDAGVTVVWLEGEHDMFTQVHLCETIARAIATDDADLVVDLSGVDFMGAATVGVIVRARSLLAQRSRSLVLRSPPRWAQRVLDVCGVSLVGPHWGAAAPLGGTATALRTWVAVPAIGRVDPREDASPPADRGASDPASVGAAAVPAEA